LRAGSPFVASLPFGQHVNYDGSKTSVTISEETRLVVSSACFDSRKGDDAGMFKLLFRLDGGDDEEDGDDEEGGDGWVCLCSFGSGEQPTCLSGLGIEATGPRTIELKVEAETRNGNCNAEGFINVFGSVLESSATGGTARIAAPTAVVNRNSDVEASKRKSETPVDALEVEEELKSQESPEKQKKKKQKVEKSDEVNDSVQDKASGDGDAKKLTKKERQKMAKRKAEELEEALAVQRGEDPSEKNKSPKKVMPNRIRSLTRERRIKGGIILQDIVIGNGLASKSGKRVSINFIGSLVDGGKVFDKNQGKAGLVFRPGTGEVIRGLERGIDGMRVGGERTVTVPPNLGYGAKGSGNEIPPNAALRFEVKLLSVG